MSSRVLFFREHGIHLGESMLRRRCRRPVEGDLELPREGRFYEVR
jgi:hypothetical protein